MNADEQPNTSKATEIWTAEIFQQYRNSLFYLHFFIFFIFQGFIDLCALENDKKIYASDKCSYVLLKSAYDKYYKEKYSFLYSESGIILPYLKCNTCKKYFFFYKIDRGSIRANSYSNNTTHKCEQQSSTVQQPLLNFAPVKLGDELRDIIVKEMALLIGNHPTLSSNATTDYTNRLLNKIVPAVLKFGRPFKSDISRQNVSSNIIELGNIMKKSNQNFFNENILTSCLIFDHWTQHGINFFGGIGRTCKKNFAIHQYFKFLVF